MLLIYIETIMLYLWKTESHKNNKQSRHTTIQEHLTKSFIFNYLPKPSGPNTKMGNCETVSIDATDGYNSCPNVSAE